MAGSLRSLKSLRSLRNYEKVFQRFSAFFSVCAALCVAACSDDDSKIKIDLDSVSTGDVTEITSTSAVISGYYNYYALVGSMVEDGFEEYDETAKVSKQYLRSLSETIFGPVVDTLSVDSVTLEFDAYDMTFDQAGICLSTNHDFYEPEGEDLENIIYTRGFAEEDKTIMPFSEKVTGLKPGTTYFYKTYLAVSFICEYTSPELQNVNGEPWSYVDRIEDTRIESLRENYVIYGLTKSFTTAQ